MITLNIREAVKNDGAQIKDLMNAHPCAFVSFPYECAYDLGSGEMVTEYNEDKAYFVGELGCTPIKSCDECAMFIEDKKAGHVFIDYVVDSNMPVHDLMDMMGSFEREGYAVIVLTGYLSDIIDALNGEHITE